MAARKPLMTPEQQKNFKEAVEKKLINPLPYDQYCKLTPEEAEKMLKEVNMGTQAPAKAALSTFCRFRRQSALPFREAPRLRFYRMCR